MKISAEDQKQVMHNDLVGASRRKRLKRWLGDYKWMLLGIIWVITIILGFVGFSKHFSDEGVTRSVWDRLYLSLQLFGLESGSVPVSVSWELQLARFLAPAIAVYTVIQALAVLLRDQFQLLRVRFFRNHIVICGLGRKGFLLCRKYSEIGERVVVIEQDEGNDMLGPCRESGAVVLIGNAANLELLRKARVHKAKHVISVCGTDGINAEVAVRGRDLVWDRKGKALTCLVHIVDLQLCNLLREREIRMGRIDAFRLGFFNVFESGARVMLNEYPPFSKLTENQGSELHIIVVGLGRMGESTVLNAVRRWRDRGRADGEHRLITLIDKDAKSKKESLCYRYPQLEQVCDLVAEQMDIQGLEFERAEFLFDHHGRCNVTAIYVCLDDDSRALSTGLTLRQRLGSVEIPTVIRTTDDTGLATLLQDGKDDSESFATVHPFGLLDRTCTPDLILGCTYEILAQAIHEDYVRAERGKGLTPTTNPSMVSWGKLAEGLKESNRNAAEHIRIKMEAIGCDIVITNDWSVQLFEFSPEEVERMAEMEHERWSEERLRTGWTYGPKRNNSKKAHPSLIIWDDLSEEEKEKDRNLVRDIPSFLARAGFNIYRLEERA